MYYFGFFGCEDFFVDGQVFKVGVQCLVVIFQLFWGVLVKFGVVIFIVYIDGQGDVLQDGQQ